MQTSYSVNIYEARVIANGVELETQAHYKQVIYLAEDFWLHAGNQ